MLTKKIIPIVLHRIVKSQAIDFEDVTLENLKVIFGQNKNQYLTVLDDLKIRQNTNYYMVTFDDGYLSDYEIVYPLINKLKVKATFFINPCNIGKSGFLTWNMVQEMSNSGLLIGSHGYNHSNMLKLTKNDAKREFVMSRRIIEKKIGKPVNNFSFPYGKFNQDLVNLAFDCGYVRCFISKHGVINSYEDIIPRNSINSKIKKDKINSLLFVSNKTLVRWQIEDLGKKIVKIIFGDNLYKKIRSFLFNIKTV